MLLMLLMLLLTKQHFATHLVSVPGSGPDDSDVVKASAWPLSIPKGDSLDDFDANHIALTHLNPMQGPHAHEEFQGVLT